MANKTDLSVDTRGLRVVNKGYPFILLMILIIGYFGLFKELTGHPLLIILFVIFLMGMLFFWYRYMQTDIAYYCSMARRVSVNGNYLNVGEIDTLFRSNKLTSVPIELVDRIEYLGHMQRRYLMYYMYAVYLKKPFHQITNPIVFVESHPLSLFTVKAKPSQQWNTPIALRILELMEKREHE